MAEKLYDLIYVVPRMRGTDPETFAEIRATVERVLKEYPRLKADLANERKARKAVEKIKADEVAVARENWRMRTEGAEAALEVVQADLAACREREARLVELLSQPHFQGVPLMQGGDYAVETVMVDRAWYDQLKALHPEEDGDE